MRRTCYPWILLLAWAGIAAHAEDRTAWMKQARFGVMSHYLSDWIARADGHKMTIQEWNSLIEHFDVEALAQQVASTGAGYFQITIGQNSGFYLSPNATYDRLVGIKPSKCSRRDLVADLYEALHKKGIRLMVYLPSGAPNGDALAKRALDWQNGPYRNREFQFKWQQVIREWSLRWGKKISGWWFDGCYWPNTMYRSAEPPNFESFAAAARAGNPESVIAFNPGVMYRAISITPFEDFTAGEVDYPDRWYGRRLDDGKVDGERVHVLTYLGQTWGTGPPRFNGDEAVEFSRKIAGAGGAVTWDTPIQRGGTFSQPFLNQLTAIGKALGRLQ